ncbi:uncharacterized protein HaLaN_29330 [Haematococcus lacustris]|uniref:Uncharacterized protein n=1 Tax=Haematococcus lacustris TaxID=44745 RepID=A0A6A0AF34_HAELA|nr:uncharacterized protein HaLaN_29330 [Haematococcus lacustris]
MDPELQPALHKERERLMGFAKRVSKAEAAEELQKARPTLALNVAAANRFIDAAIPDLSSQQREMLRAASSGVKRQAAEQDAAARPHSKRGAGRTGAPGQSGGRSGSRDHAMAFLQQVMQEGVKTEAALPPQQHGDSDSSDA